MVTIPPYTTYIFMVMTGEWFIIVLITLVIICYNPSVHPSWAVPLPRWGSGKNIGRFRCLRTIWIYLLFSYGIRYQL